LRTRPTSEVSLNILPEHAADAFSAVLDKVKAARPDARIEGVLISPMRQGGIELFVGIVRDPIWGLAIAVGFGGIYVELLKDTALRLLPVGTDDVLGMLAQLRGRALLDGFRGAPPVNLQAVAKAVVAIGDAALALGPDLAAMDINPLRADDIIAEALDGLVIWNSAEGRG
jgi:acetate---CoA ligase (ADP-forming)